jgi:hypothetical protein
MGAVPRPWWLAVDIDSTTAGLTISSGNVIPDGNVIPGIINIKHIGRVTAVDKRVIVLNTPIADWTKITRVCFASRLKHPQIINCSQRWGLCHSKELANEVSNASYRGRWCYELSR